MVDSSTIREFSQKIVERYRPRQIILFGSYAAGKATPDSDVDILVILSFEGKNAAKSAEILTATDPRFPVDLIVRTPRQVEERLKQGDFFLTEILKEGVVLYESAHSGMD